MVDTHDTQCYDGVCYSPLITLKAGILKMPLLHHSHIQKLSVVLLVHKVNFKLHAVVITAVHNLHLHCPHAWQVLSQPQSA